MKVEITTMELAELLNTIQGRHRVSQNPLGMSADELVEKVADRVMQKVQAAIEENQAEDEENDDEALACTLADHVAERVEALISETRRATPILLADQAAVTQLLHTEGIDAEPAGRPQEEHPEAELPETVGDLYESEKTQDPDYPNQIIAEKEGPEKVREPRTVSMPVWDEEAGVYVVDNAGHVGRDLWNKDKYRGWFNEEIRQLRKDGKSPQYIADRIKVTAQAVKARMRNYKID
jgi:hypothetical protein